MWATATDAVRLVADTLTRRPDESSASATAWDALASELSSSPVGGLGLDDAALWVLVVTAALEIDAELARHDRGDGPLRPATVESLECSGRIVGLPPWAVRRSLQAGDRLAQLQLVTLGSGASAAFADRVVIPDEWWVELLATGVAARPVQRHLTWLDRVATDAHPMTATARLGEPLLATGADPAREATRAAAAWQRAAVAMLRVDAPAGWEDDPDVVAVVRQCLAEGAGLLVTTSARHSDATAAAEALAGRGVPIALHDPAAAGYTIPPGWGALQGDGRHDAVALAADVRRSWSELAPLATHVNSEGASWSQLVLPRRTEQHLREVAGAIAAHRTVMDSWQFGRGGSGRGLHVLFNGPSGTGKTLASRVLAREAGLELWMVDLAQVVDKYIGESEKRLDQVLTAAAACGAMLLFDEAESLFGRRGETHDARDRWANLQVSFLLQRIERHPGVTILTTNLGQQLDDAFQRRLGHRIDFPLPDAALRRRLWRVAIPAAAPLADDGDLPHVADRFELSGGGIRNAALTAAYDAATRGNAIGRGELVRAAVRELTKAGRAPTRAELADDAIWLMDDRIAGHGTICQAAGA